MNMPNLASCHHAILLARVSAILVATAELGPSPYTFSLFPVESPCAREALAANAPVAPNPLRKDLLELESQSMMILLAALNRSRIDGRFRIDETIAALIATSRGGLSALLMW